MLHVNWVGIIYIVCCTIIVRLIAYTLSPTTYCIYTHTQFPMNVLLVRNPPEDRPDRYHQHLQSVGLNPYSVPVLETIHTNLGDLHNVIKGKSSVYGGVILTSSRSAECWDLIRKELSSVQEFDSVNPGEQHYNVMRPMHEPLK